MLGVFMGVLARAITHYHDQILQGDTIARMNELPARLYRVNPETGERAVWREIVPPDPTGIFRIGRVRTNADASAHGYVYYMHLVDLHVAHAAGGYPGSGTAPGPTAS